MYSVFRCPQCGNALYGWPPMNSCRVCEYELNNPNGIYMFTDEPNMNLDNERRKYVGFDVIAASYDKSRGIEALSKEGTIVAQFLGAEKIILEIGAGTGFHSMSMALSGCRVVAGDISLNMLKIMRSKVNNEIMEHLIPCRLNAYSLPLLDDSVDAVFVDRLFHLIETPELVIGEIKRVMKPEACFITIAREGSILSGEEEVDQFNSINNKISEYYDDLVRCKGIKLIERFGWLSGKAQQENLRMHFNEYTVIDSDKLIDKYSITIGQILSNYRNLAHVNQALADPNINNQIVDEIEVELLKEYGDGFKSIKTSYADRSRIKVYKL